MAAWQPTQRKVSELVTGKSILLLDRNDLRKAFLFQNTEATMNAFVESINTQGQTLGWKVPPGQSFSDPNADGVCPHTEQWWVTVDVAPTGTGITFAEKV